MTYGKLKKKKIYKEANDVFLCVNGEEPVNEIYYPVELDHLQVIGTGYMSNGYLLIDIGCNNWSNRHDINWIAR